MLGAMSRVLTSHRLARLDRAAVPAAAAVLAAAALSTALLLGGMTAAHAAVQLRVEPVFPLKSDVNLQGVRVRALGLRPGTRATVLLQTRGVQYQAGARAGRKGELSLEMPYAGPLLAPETDENLGSIALVVKGKSIATAWLPVVGLETPPGPGYLLLVGSTSDALAHLALLQQTADLPFTGRGVSTVELPRRWFGYGPVSAIVGDADSLDQLEPDQITALTDWLQAGGLLVTYPGVERAVPAGEDLRVLSPLDAPTSARPTVRRLDALARAVGDRARFGAQRVWSSAPVPGATVVGDSRAPLVGARRVGLGFWLAMAVDPTEDGLARSDHRKALWAWALGSSRTGMGSGTSALARPFFGEQPPVDTLPSGWALAAIGAIYVVMVGPVSFWVLRRLDRRDLAWATIPAISLAFTGAMFGVGLAARGGALASYETEVVAWGRDAQRGVSQLGVSVFAPRTSQYAADLAGDWVPYPVLVDNAARTRPLFTVSFRPASVAVRELMIPRWSIRRVSATGLVRRPAPFQFELAQKGPRFIGAVKNVSTSTVDVWLWDEPDRVLSLGTLTPNQTLAVDVTRRELRRAPEPRLTGKTWERRALGSLLSRGPYSMEGGTLGADLVLMGVPHPDVATAKVPGAGARVARVWMMPAVPLPVPLQPKKTAARP
jgi:hypothetical protein